MSNLPSRKDPMRMMKRQVTGWVKITEQRCDNGSVKLILYYIFGRRYLWEKLSED